MPSASQAGTEPTCTAWGCPAPASGPFSREGRAGAGVWLFPGKEPATLVPLASPRWSRFWKRASPAALAPCSGGSSAWSRRFQGAPRWHPRQATPRAVQLCGLCPAQTLAGPGPGGGRGQKFTLQEEVLAPSWGAAPGREGRKVTPGGRPGVHIQPPPGRVGEAGGGELDLHRPRWSGSPS